MTSGNSVSITGNLTRDAEFRSTPSGRVVCDFGIGHNERRRDQNGGWTDIPNFFNVSVWMSDNQARSFEGRLYKGTKIAIVDGSLKQETWEKDGQKRSAVRIVVNDPFASLAIETPVNANRSAQAQPQSRIQQYTQQPPQQYAPQQQYQQPQPYQQQQYASQQPQYAQTSIYDQDIPF